MVFLSNPASTPVKIIPEDQEERFPRVFPEEENIQVILTLKKTRFRYDNLRSVPCIITLLSPGYHSAVCAHCLS